MPAFHLQPFDVVSSDDFADNTLRYIAGLREVYNPHAKDKYTDRQRRPGWWQTLTLSELTGDAAGMSAINLIDAATHGTALVRGSLVSFDSSTWKALVRLDESHSAIPMYVGEWISPANLDTGRRVAVLLFDAANPDDGLVIGTFGTVRWRQFDRLYASDGNPAPALSMDASGNAEFAARILGGIGSVSTGGTQDWDHITNSRSGCGYTLLQGTDAHGPGPGSYFYPFNFEYITKNGSGNITQLAIPYSATGHINQGLYMRGRFSDTWTGWYHIASVPV